MLFNNFVLALVFFATASARAQGVDNDDDGFEDDGIECIQSCLPRVVPSSPCTSTTDLICLCTNNEFLEAMSTCVQQTCPEDVQLALDHQASTCAAVGGPTTTSGSTSTNGNINSSTRTHSDSPSSTRTDDNSASTRTSSPSSTATSGSSPHVGPEYDSLFAVVLGAFLGVDLIV